MKIAVCLYGQWREGDRCSPRIKDFFNTADPDISVDYFCASKPNNMYANMPAGIFDSNISEEYIIDKLVSNYNPKLVGFTDDTITAKECNSFGHRLESLIHSVMLKKSYEITNNITYDLVIVTRYDIVVEPLDYFKRLCVNFKGKFNHYLTSGINFILSEPILRPPESSEYMCIGANQIHWGDTFLIGNNTAINLLAAELLAYTDYSENNDYERMCGLDTHTLLHKARNDSKILEFYPYPKFNLNSEDIMWVSDYIPGHPSYDTDNYDIVQIRFVRPGFDWSGEDIFAKSTMDKLHQFYMANLKW